MGLFSALHYPFSRDGILNYRPRAQPLRLAQGRQEWLCHKIVSDGGYFLPAASFLPTSLWCSTAALGAKSSISKNCRTSTSLSSCAPKGAGIFLAQSMASCRDFTLIIQ